MHRKEFIRQLKEELSMKKNPNPTDYANTSQKLMDWDKENKFKATSNSWEKGNLDFYRKLFQPGFRGGSKKRTTRKKRKNRKTNRRKK